MTEEEARAFVAARCKAMAMEKLDRFVSLLAEENERQNLVAAASLAMTWSRHVADSAQLLDHVPRETAAPWLDLGTGAGLPGLVIAIMRPELDVRLVESRAKRVAWLDLVKAQLALEKVSVLGTRLELVESFHAGVISARAFAPLPKLIDLAARFSTDDTCWVLPKGRSAEQELQNIPRRWRERFHVEQSKTDPSGGVLVAAPRTPVGAA